MEPAARFEELMRAKLLVMSEVAASGLEERGGHGFSAHTPLWAYLDPHLQTPFDSLKLDGRRQVFDFLPQGTTLDQAVANTRFLVFAGAGQSEVLDRAVRLPEPVKLVFEPNFDLAARFVDRYPAEVLKSNKVFLFVGMVDRLVPPLGMVLSWDVCSAGYPVFFVQQGMETRHSGYLDRVIRGMEIFFYRHALYPLGSQDNVWGRPLRTMARTENYDCVTHRYENFVANLSAGTLQDLKGRFKGKTAVLVAAGPDLEAKLDWLARNRDRAVIVAVNSALKTLQAAGVEPHFALINDTSISVEATFKGLAPMPRTYLVAHCLSFAGNGLFPRVYFFGNVSDQPFPVRDKLELHGSVITAAFSLARYMGCSRAVFVGAQLCSPDPYSLAYAGRPGSGDEGPALINRHPQLCPVTVRDGGTRFTTLNFLDAASWLLDRIRMSGMEAVNTSAQSILFNGRVRLDQDPVLAPDPEVEAMFCGLPLSVPDTPALKVKAYLLEHLAFWNKVKGIADEISERVVRDPGVVEDASAWIAEFDKNNVSFMLQRYCPHETRQDPFFGDWIKGTKRNRFVNELFHYYFFDRDLPSYGVQYYFSHLAGMAGVLCDLLDAQLKKIGKGRR